MNAHPRILFVNRMAAMQRGGGETFDLEISAELARMGCQVTMLCGWPVMRRRPETEIRGQKSGVRSQSSIAQSSTNQAPRTKDQERFPPSTLLRRASGGQVFNLEPSTLNRRILLRSPYLPWFPWDRVKGGWRVRVWEFQQFEKKAAKWIRKHADEFDVIQICELPYLVSLLKTSSFAHCPLPIVLRLTAPNAYDPWGGIQLADAVIASGTSIEKVRKSLRPDVVDVPNGVDLKRFRPMDNRQWTIGNGRWTKDDGQWTKDDGQWTKDQSPMAHRPSPIDNRLLAVNSAFRALHKISPSAPVLLYVARFQAFKNHRLLIDAFGRVLREAPEAWLVLAGSGPLRGEIEDRGRRSEIGKKVLFLGEVAFEELPEVYAAADVKVISSDYESFCFAAIEAMASGLPVVTTDCGWVPRLLGDPLPPVERQWFAGDDPPERFDGAGEGQRIREAPGGLIAARGDPASLANAIVSMLKEPELRRECGAWNREKAVREHGWESSARKLLGVYEGLVLRAL